MANGCSRSHRPRVFPYVRTGWWCWRCLLPRGRSRSRAEPRRGRRTDHAPRIPWPTGGDLGSTVLARARWAIRRVPLRRGPLALGSRSVRATCWSGSSCGGSLYFRLRTGRAPEPWASWRYLCGTFDLLMGGFANALTWENRLRRDGVLLGPCPCPPASCPRWRGAAAPGDLGRERPGADILPGLLRRHVRGSTTRSCANPPLKRLC